MTAISRRYTSCLLNLPHSGKLGVQFVTIVCRDSLFLIPDKLIRGTEN